ncbi:MAG: hypothetical protein JW804_00380 [Sedimentisphaerales bacterium]|nr:hypothetical protein [Sedimentisphaerales bacterium]
MKKNTALKIINPILLLLLINQAASGLFHGQYSHQAFEILHEGAGKVFIGLAIVHFILNFSWIKASYFKKRAV